MRKRQVRAVVDAAGANGNGNGNGHGEIDRSKTPQRLEQRPPDRERV
jgi:hypothetical protein